MTAVCAALLLSGCTSIHDYVHNGFKVGPNYCGAQACVAPHWIEASDVRVRQESGDLSHWWTVFRDPVLDRLIQCAYNQNLTVREAAFKILQAKANLLIAQGNLFPQTQTATGSYRRIASSGQGVVPPFFTDQWTAGFNLSWEIDFWGRLRRAIESNEDTLEASWFNYDDIVVTMLGQVATNYVNARTYQRQIELLRKNVALQQDIVNYTTNRFQAGSADILDDDQARATLEQTAAQIPPLQISLRQAEDQLCVLLGIPAVDLDCWMGVGPIPVPPNTVVVGIPADLLRRRPDIREAERTAAAQAEQIGIAEAQLYPIFTLNGTIGVQAYNFSQLVSPNAFNGTAGPSFVWNILNYGRLVNGVRAQDANFRLLVETYRQTVLVAEQEVEDGIANFLRSQEETQWLDKAVGHSEGATTAILNQLEAGRVDINRVSVIEQTLVAQQNLQAQAQGSIALGLIQVYVALGGGWEIRCPEMAAQGEPLPEAEKPAESVPAPQPKPPAEPPAPPPPGALPTPPANLPPPADKSGRT